MHANNSRHPDGRVELVRKLLWLSRRHFQALQAGAEERGLGSGQIPVLMELKKWGGLSQRELAEKTRVTPATMSGTLKRMEKAGYICRAADEKDARISRVRLTEEGLRQCESATNAFDALCIRMLEGLTEGEQAQLDGLLTRLQKNLDGGDCRRESSKKGVES